jgi:hypothetical protein|tara:strand:+ start:319 stop:495 length:177 start_codon:yes stop_codon:yes gene_type:complete
MKLTSKQVKKYILQGALAGLLLMVIAFIPLFFEERYLYIGYFLSIGISYFLFFYMIEL